VGYKKAGRLCYGSAYATPGLKKKPGFDDPRFHNEDCDLCGNSAFRDGYREGDSPQNCAFEPAPAYPGYLRKPTYEGGSTRAMDGNVDTEALVRMITDQVMAAMAK